MADNKEALPVVAYRYEFFGTYEYPIDPVFVDACDKWESKTDWSEVALTDHATATAALSELRAEVGRLRVDAERLDWLERAGPTSFGVVIDAPHDGEYYVAPDDTPTGYGKTFRAAIDAARSAGHSS